jgi:PKD repeat protein
MAHLHRTRLVLAGLIALGASTACQPAGSTPEVNLTATPRLGAPPLQVSFQWAVDAGPGAALQCSLDFGGDGSAAAERAPCPANGSAAHTYTSLGTFHPTLTVSNTNGGGSTQATAQVVLQSAVADLSIARVEWGQTLITTSPRLVGLKPALLRVHVVAAAGGVGPIAVRAVGSLDGGTLGTLDLVGPETLPTAPVDDDVTQSFTAVVPPDWVTPGFRLDVRIDADDVVPEPDETNNTATLTPVVGPATLLPLTLVPVVQNGLQPRALLDPWFTTVWRYWPVAQLSNHVRATYTFDGTLDAADVSGWQSLLDQIDALRTTDQSNDWYYGYARVDYISGLAGLGLVGEPAAIGRDDSERALTHELGHTFNLFHAPCGGASNPDPDYPYPGAEIGVWGWDLVFQRLVNPTTSFDVMSYCSPTWVSDFSYGRAQVHLEANAPALAFAVAPGAGTEAFLVHGHLDADETVVFQPIQRVHAVPSPAATPGFSWRIRVETAEGAVDVSPRVVDVADSGAVRFSAVVPAPGPVVAVALSRDGRELGRVVRQPRGAPRFAPRATAVDGGWLLEWDADATPALAVTFVGERRTTLALSLRGGRAFVPSDGLGEGDLELSASDGVSAQMLRLDRQALQTLR